MDKATWTEEALVVVADNESDDNIMSDEVKPTKQTRPKWMFIKQLMEYVKGIRRSLCV